MTNTYTVPADREMLLADTETEAEFFNATGWRLAAKVTALVGPPTGPGRKPKNVGNSPHYLGIRELAARRRKGLKDPKVIMYYRDCWLRHFSVPQPGETIDFDAIDIDWPGIPPEELARHTGMTPERKDTLLEAGKAAGMPTGAKVVDIAANLKALGLAIKADPETERAAREALDEVAATRHERLRPPPGTPEGKAIEARLSAQNDATTKIAIPIFDACVLLEGAQREWEDEWPNLSEREKGEVDRTLGEIVVIVEALRFNLSVEEPR